MKADKNDDDRGELFVDGGKEVAEGFRDEGSKRSFKEDIVVCEHANDGGYEENGEQSQCCKPSQCVVSYVGAVFLEEGFKASENSVRVGQEESKARGL